MMKRKICIGLLILLVLSMYCFSGGKEFRTGAVFLSPQIAFNTWSPSMGVSLEVGISPNIGIGGTLMFSSWTENYMGLGKVSEMLITPAFDFYYHFTKIKLAKFDLFVGASMGFSIYSWSWDYEGNKWDDAAKSGIFLSPFLGARYYLAKKIAICLRLNSSLLGDWTGFGGLIGVTFRLK